ncbi:hypothetical protein JCM17380_24570 [Desulfosporosinus burensis]
MKVFINGKITREGRMDELVSEIVNTMGKRIGVPENTKITIEGLGFKVIFHIDGVDTYATVPRDVNGETVNEMFSVSVHLDEDGNIIQTEDNEEESFYDGYTLAKSVGQEYQYEGTESAYSNDELELLESLGENTGDDVMAVKYRVIADPETEVLRHYKGDLLVAEYVYKPKGELN